MKVLLENLLRHERAPRPARRTSRPWPDDRQASGVTSNTEIAFTPERVLMQDFTGVPGVVDLAASVTAAGCSAATPLDPSVPVELVIDHSVIAESSGLDSSFATNVDIEYGRNIEQYQLLRWRAQQAFDGFSVVPPGTGICHQVNLEYLARVVFATEDGQAFPDTLVGTDSHTTMVNGLGVLGWGVGGIEAEAVPGQPLARPRRRAAAHRRTAGRDDRHRPGHDDRPAVQRHRGGRQVRRGARPRTGAAPPRPLSATWPPSTGPPA